MTEAKRGESRLELGVRPGRSPHKGGIGGNVRTREEGAGGLLARLEVMAGFDGIAASFSRLQRNAVGGARRWRAAGAAPGEVLSSAKDRRAHATIGATAQKSLAWEHGPAVRCTESLANPATG